MYYEIWIDILFIVNAWIDFLLLRLVSYLLGGTATPIRSMLGACIGASVVCFLTIFSMSPMVNTLLVHVVGNTIMVRFGCNLKKMKKICAGVFLLYGTTIFMGGFLQWIQNYVGQIMLEGILLVATLGYVLLRVGLWIYASYRCSEENVYCATLYANGKSKETRAFLDTGNHLYDSVSGKPVCIIGITMLEGLYSARTIECLRHFQIGMECGEEIHKLRPHYIPFSSLGCSNGILLAVTLDVLCLENQKIQKVITRPVIAFSSENSSFLGNYQMILHPNLIDS